MSEREWVLACTNFMSWIIYAVKEIFVSSIFAVLATAITFNIKKMQITVVFNL